MRGQSFNDGWRFRRIAAEGEQDAPFEEVTLPHDAMIGETRSPQAVSGRNSGWFEGHDYEYVKTWVPAEDLLGKSLALEFEGGLPPCAGVGRWVARGREALRLHELLRGPWRKGYTRQAL